MTGSLEPLLVGKVEHTTTTGREITIGITDPHRWAVAQSGAYTASGYHEIVSVHRTKNEARGARYEAAGRRRSTRFLLLRRNDDGTWESA